MAHQILSSVERYLAARLFAEHVGTPEALSKVADAKAELRDKVDTQEGATGRPYPRILVAVDHAKHPALTRGFQLAEALGAKLAIVHVVDLKGPPSHLGTDSTRARLLEGLRQAGREMLSMADAQVPAEIYVECFLREGCPAQEIVGVAKQWHADIIVIGTHRRSALASFFLGSASEAVIREATCPVLLVADGLSPVPTVTEDVYA